MVRDIDLLHYLPPFVQEYREMQKVMKAEEPEFQLVADESEVLKNNQFIETCNEVGIARFEKILHITPSSEDTLDSRKSRVKIRWNDAVPYTWNVFLMKMQTLCGDDFTVVEDWNNYQLHLTTHLDLYGQIDELENILEYMPPANIEVIANNELNYKVDGSLYSALGMAFADIFELTDSFRVNWTIEGNAGGAVVGSGTCEIELTDSFSDAEISVGSAAKTGLGVAYTTII